MDEYQYRALRKASKNDIQLMKTSDHLKTLQSELEVIGEFPTVLRNKTRGIETKFPGDQRPHGFTSTVIKSITRRLGNVENRAQRHTEGAKQPENQSSTDQSESRKQRNRRNSQKA